MEKYHWRQAGLLKAALILAPTEIRLVDLDLPSTPDDSVQVRPEVVGICGSDLNLYRGIWKPSRFAPGHEFSGTVTKVGSAVDGISEGERVCARAFESCGKCAFCKRGEINLCSSAKYLGESIHGGLSEYTSVGSSALYRIPDNMSFEEGAFVEPLAVCVHALRRARVKAGSSVMIIGGGTIGLLNVVCARAQKASEIVVFSRYPHQASAALRAGADDVVQTPLNGSQEPITRSSDEVDIVIDTVGSSHTLNLGLSSVKAGGTLCILGGSGEPLSVEGEQTTRIVTKEILVVGSFCYSISSGIDDFRVAAELILNGDFKFDSLVTHRFPFDRVGDAFAAAANKRSGAIKVHVYPQERSSNAV
jgi:L-iditol 2-dehydrogenase